MFSRVPVFLLSPLKKSVTKSMMALNFSTSEGFKLALLQLKVGLGKTQNLANAVKEIHYAKEKGAQLVALPDFFNAPYGVQYLEEYAEEIPSGPSCAALRCAALEAGVCVVGGTMPERHRDKFYNSCTVWDEKGNLVAVHRKLHLFDVDLPGGLEFKESDVLSAGDEITTFDFRGIRIGLGACYDLRFFEMAQMMAKEGCSLLLYPGAFTLTTGQLHWEILARARATDLQLWVALVSPARDMTANYVAWGHSMIVDPWGAVVLELDEAPGILMIDIDSQLVENVRSQIPVWKHRRTDLYDTVSPKYIIRKKM
ncbi:omega-amidase NIT2-like isoform X2 [Trichoplusia ni]|uniref:omega-amidase n=1 Tax=Trichoplusia ni TaxID=7111 RepID=A0A7E5VH34_TRINI|nr:omega-amidase NIT2-like isoform X2 [Trichoplusia ni]